MFVWLVGSIWCLPDRIEPWRFTTEIQREVWYAFEYENFEWKKYKIREKHVFCLFVCWFVCVKKKMTLISVLFYAKLRRRKAGTTQNISNTKCQ